MIIAVDFDGTVVDYDFPNIGQNVPGAAEAMQRLQLAGHKIVLFTMRSGDYLKDAIEWFNRNGIALHGVNKEPEQASWTSSPKAYAHVYVDDSAIGVPLIELEGFNRPVVDWPAVETLIQERQELIEIQKN
jgi:hypothetical protein